VRCEQIKVAMLSVGTIDEVRAFDAKALASISEATLIARAGTATAHAAMDLMGGAYGRRVVVIAGKGNNGADGRVAARALRGRGASVEIVAPSATAIAPCDLIIDAAFGTGFRGTYEAPIPAGRTPVLAVDLPSGLDADSGAASGSPLVADRTVTFACLKRGLLQDAGPRLAGDVRIADIGIDTSGATAALVEDTDVDQWLRPREAGSHKWSAAVAIVAGSPGMYGAAVLSALGASHAGAGMVRLCVPGRPDAASGVVWPTEAVRTELPAQGWSTQMGSVLERCKALVIGPGLGRDEQTQVEIRRLVAEARVPIVVDADALFALSAPGALSEEVRGTSGVARPVVVTPHDGEYRLLTGRLPGTDRAQAARALATASGAVVLVKGSLTAVASPADDAPVLFCTAGSPRLATAGTGDVLSGIIAAFLARGIPASWAAVLGAHVHGRAAARGSAVGLVAPDLPPLVAGWLSDRIEARGGENHG
jgi:ADP-dependent NAD(P)H-hydrate dehydratase / NAD(P)H-hydrate epimerase